MSSRLTKIIVGVAVLVSLYGGMGVGMAQVPQDNTPLSGNLSKGKNPYTGIVCGDGTANIPGCLKDTTSFDSVLKKSLPAYSLFQVGFIGVIAIVVVSVAGVFLVTSMGDPGKKKKAMGMVYNAIIAMIVAMLAYVIVQIVLQIDFNVTTMVPHALAQGTSNLIPSPPTANNPGQSVTIPQGNPNQNLGYFAQAGLNVLFYIVGPIVVVMFFIVGIKLVMSEGKDDDFKKGMKAMGYAALGLSLIGLAYAVVRTILSIRF